MQNNYETIEFEEPAGFRSWLAKNVFRQEGVWLRIYKKATGVKSITYAEALDEALCYGWIDGLKKSYDEVSYIQRFTPRRKQSLWSKRNKKHVERLRNSGKMTEFGEAEVTRAMQDGRWDAAYDAPSTMVAPEYFAYELHKNAAAKLAFEKLSKSQRYIIVWQLQTAKTETTRMRRMEKIIATLARN